MGQNKASKLLEDVFPPSCPIIALFYIPMKVELVALQSLAILIISTNYVVFDFLVILKFFKLKKKKYFPAIRMLKTF